MSSIAKSRRESKGKTSKQAKATSRNRLDKLPAKGVRLARVLLSDLVGKAPTTLLDLEGWQCYGHTGHSGRSSRIHLRGRGRDASFTKACDAIELWATPVFAGDPADYLDIHFRNTGGKAEAYVRVGFDGENRDGMCLLALDTGDREQYASISSMIPPRIGEALLQRIFPHVPVVARRNRSKANASKAAPEDRDQAFARLGRACTGLLRDQFNLLCKHLEALETAADQHIGKANGKGTAAGRKAGASC